MMAGQDSTLVEDARDGIVLARDEGVLRIVLDRPEKLNALNDASHARLRDAFARAAADPEIRAVLLTGRGRAFCAGQDLGDRDPSAGPRDLEQSAKLNYGRLIRAVRGLDKPVVCAVNGVAAGAGANLALACDIVLAAESARFVQAFARIGLTLDAGGSWFLPRLVGEARAKAIALTGAPVSAREAQAWGMIWRAVPDDALMPEALALARALAAGPTFALGLTKRAIELSATNDLDTQIGLEAKFQGLAGRSRDYAEGVAAFLAKRPARFSGEPPET